MSQFIAPFGEAELEASVELLAFLWVAAGRDPAYITPEAVQMVRLALVQNIATMEPSLQFALINAKALQAELRSAWEQATPEQQREMALQFGQALDALGLPDPQAPAAGAWSQGGESADGSLAGLAQTTAWNLAQKSSGGW